MPQLRYTSFNMQSINEIIDNPEVIEDLYAQYHGKNAMTTQRIANLFLQLTISHTELIQPYLAKLLNELNSPQTDAVKRNTTRIFREIKVIPEDLLGQLTSICFDYAASPSEAIAVRAFALHILRRVAKIEPDILPELRMVAEDAMLHGSAGLRCVASKIIN
jgi:hypothetical protein